MRRAHLLRGNHTLEAPQSCIWVDTETHEESIGPQKVRHLLTFGWAVHQRTRAKDDWTEPDWFRFETAEEFWTWALSKTRAKTRLYIFAHNWGFDGPVLHAFSLLPSLGWKLRATVIESPPVILRWRSTDRSIVMLDTLNWWRMPLKKLGERIGAAKLTMPDKDASKESWDVYCRQDVEVIRLTMFEWWAFLKTHRLGGFAPTLASQAMRAFRHRFLDHDVLLDDSEDALSLARTALAGGRVECFQIGKVQGPVYHYDVNSMYPAVMEDQEYPTVLKATARDARKDELARWLERWSVVAECTVETDEPCYALRQHDKLVFPVGHFRCSLTSPDLEYALHHDHLLQVHHAAVYTRGRIFARFVQELYKLRQQAGAAGDGVSTFMLKILMNSLYGKFAQRGTHWTRSHDTEDPSISQWKEIDAHTREIRHLRQFSGTVQEKLREEESYDSHPAIAAHVTAYARRKLWEFIVKAGRENVFYCDTDSLFTNSAGAARLAGSLDQSRLGALKHEATYEWMTIRGAKDYETPKGLVVKGVRGRARWLGPNVVEHEEWSRLGGLVRQGQLDAPVVVKRTKTLRRVYEKGTVSASGRVVPFSILP